MQLLMRAAGVLLLVGLAIWGSTVVPVVLGVGALLFLHSKVSNRPISKLEPLALVITFALSFAFMLSTASDKLIYDGSRKFFEVLMGLGIFALACTAMLAAVYYLGGALSNIRPDKRRLAPFLAPIVILLPRMFTDIGNSYRKRLLLALMVFGGCFVVLRTLKSMQ